MTCQRYDYGNTTLFVCDKSKQCKCGQRAVTICQFELKGYKRGELCARKLCDNCARKVGDKIMCRVHAELVGKQEQQARREARARQ